MKKRISPINYCPGCGRTENQIEVIGHDEACYDKPPHKKSVPQSKTGERRARVR